MLARGLHLAKGLCMTIWNEHRVVAKTLAPPRRPDQGAFDLTLESLHMAIGPSEAQSADEASTA